MEKSKSKPKIELRSIVATTYLAPPIDLQTLESRACKSGGCRIFCIREEHSPIEAVVDLTKPEAHFSLCPDGKVEIIGYKSRKQAEKALERLITFLTRLGFRVSNKESEITIKEVIYGAKIYLDEESDYYEILRKAFSGTSLGRSAGGRFETPVISIGKGFIKVESDGDIIARRFENKKEAVEAIKKVIKVLCD